MTAIVYRLEKHKYTYFSKQGHEMEFSPIYLLDGDLPDANQYHFDFPESNETQLSVIDQKITKEQFDCNFDSSWCPPCENSKKCFFNGTIYNIMNLKARVKKDLHLLNDNVTLSIRVQDHSLKKRDVIMTARVRPSSVTVFHPRTTKNLEENEQTTKRDVNSLEEKYFNFTLPTTAGKFTRIFDTGLHLGQKSTIDIKSTEWSKNSQKIENVLRLTSDKTILYLGGNARKINETSSLKVELETRNQMIILWVNFELFQKGDCLRNPINCAEFSIEDECTKSCGFRSGASGTCQWVPEGYNGLSYSTCSSSKPTCPDQVCDALESLSRYSICPQDCVDKSAIIMATLHMDTEDSSWKLGFGRVKRPNMVCTCNGRSCSCIHQNISHSVLQEEESNADYITDTESSDRENDSICDIKCQASICGVVATLSLLLLLLLRKRLYAAVVSHICKNSQRGTANFMANHQNQSSGSNSLSDNSENRRFVEARICRLGHRHFKVRRQCSESFSHATAPSTLSTNLSQNVHEMRAFYPSIDHSSYDSEDSYYHQIEKKWEISRSELTLDEVIGEGEFGKVMSGKLESKKVAVKMMKSNHSSREEVHDLLAEFNILKDAQHPNVIGVHGACTTKGGPVCIVMEYAEFGSLRDYLRTCRGVLQSDPGNEYMREAQILNPKDILTFAWQIAKGMEYLSLLKLVHRDLAARNVLLAKNMICKISDFGLTRDVYIDDTYWKKSNGRIPVKWLSPESLKDHLYTTKSDVWSYGVLLWELVTLGNTPYPGFQPERLLHMLTMGYRMQRPENCSDELYSLMSDCWQYLPEDRPSFSDLVRWTEKLLQNSGEYLDLSPNVVNNVNYLQPIPFPDPDNPIFEELEVEEKNECDQLVPCTTFAGQEVTLV